MHAFDDRSTDTTKPSPSSPSDLPESRQWISDQLSMIQAEIKLLIYSSLITLFGIGIALAIFLLNRS